MNENLAYTKNDAVSYKTTGSKLLDQFSKAGTFITPRPIEDVFNDQSELWDENPLDSVKFIFYLRAISRKESIDGAKIQQHGMGLKSESFMRFIWLAKEHPSSFYNNVEIFPVIGSWRDLWEIMYYDIKYQINAIEREKLYCYIYRVTEINFSQGELIKKYLPSVKSNNKCRTERAKIYNMLAKEYSKYTIGHFGNITKELKFYRNIKNKGRAHIYQKKISQGKFDEIQWSNIGGRALTILADGNFITSHNLVDSYVNYILNSTDLKFNGYPFELYYKAYRKLYKIKPYQKLTFDKQFDKLISDGIKEGGIKGNVLCCLDTSGSMNMEIKKGISAEDVATSLTIYFSELNKGYFHNKYVAFDDESKMESISGTFTDKVEQIAEKDVAWGSTNFQSVIDMLIRLRLDHPEIELSSYPTTILAISDMQFNPTANGEETNNEAMMRKLYTCFPKDFVDDMKFIWWQVNGNYSSDVPATLENSGNIVISGFDPSIITLILGGNKSQKKKLSMEDALEIALNQKVFNNIKL